MIEEIAGHTIDFSKIERVGSVGGDPSWLNYTVYFTGGGKFYIYEKREYRRVEFIKMWKEITKKDVTETCTCINAEPPSEKSICCGKPRE